MVDSAVHVSADKSRVIRLEGGLNDGREVEVPSFPSIYVADDIYYPDKMVSASYAIYRPKKYQPVAKP